MKNKRLIIILSVFAFLVLIAVLCSTVFTVKSVSLNWLVTNVNMDVSNEEIIADVEKGESVFLVDKKAIIDKLENKYPYLKVVSAEIKFPNKLILHTSVRQELYSLKLEDNKHAILDAECKVLRISSDSQLGQEIKPIPIQLEGYSYSKDNFIVSKTADIGWIKNVISNFSIALYQKGYEEIDSKNNITALNINVGGYENKITFMTRYGVGIEIQQISDKLVDKLVFGISVYDKLTESQKSQGLIRVYMTNGEVSGEYDPEW